MKGQKEVRGSNFMQNSRIEDSGSKPSWKHQHEGQLVGRHCGGREPITDGRVGLKDREGSSKNLQ